MQKTFYIKGKRRPLLLGCFAVLLAFSSFIIWRQSKANSNEESLLAGNVVISNEPIAGFDFTDSSKNIIPNEQLNSGKVLLVYLLEGCGACSTEAAILSDVQKHTDSDTKIWGVVQDSKNEANDFSKLKNSGIPIIVDKQNKLMKTLRVRYFPFNLLIKDGIIIKKWVGIKDENDFLEKLK